ncbi:MAG: NUDIX hydrolase [Alphaproteobacteria bacterium]|nr:MAG: NUDIX hydrolase [Alphaproteobacteria bacterium]
MGKVLTDPNDIPFAADREAALAEAGLSAAILSPGKRFRTSCKLICWAGDRVLLLRRADDGWELPGGRARRQEGPLECLAREVQEETGLVLAPERLVHVWLRHKPDGALRWTLVFDALAPAEWTERPVAVMPPHVGHAWMSADEAIAGMRVAGDARALRRSAARRGRAT